VAEGVRCGGALGGGSCQQRAVPTSCSRCLGFHSAGSPGRGCWGVHFRWSRDSA